MADLGGNNRLDTMQNIVASDRIAFVFVVPGQSETVRVNGEAWITTEPEVLDRFQLPRLPKAAIVTQVQTTYMHCAKAIHRSGMWDPNVWAELADTPDGAAIISLPAGERVHARAAARLAGRRLRVELATSARRGEATRQVILACRRRSTASRKSSV